MRKSVLIILSILMTIVFLSTSCTQNNIVPTEEELSADANALVEKLAQKDYKGAKSDHQYDTIMKLLTGPKTYSTIWETLLSSYGEFINIYGYEYQRASGFDNIYVKIAFEKKCVNFKVTYKKDTLKISGLHYAPNADKSSLAGAEPLRVPEGVIETSFEFGKNGLKLPAILSTPNAKGPFPVLILVHGSGPNNSDEAVGNQAPFRDIAWELALQGIAVMRYDKRTLVYPEDFGENATVEDETIEDAILAAQAVLDFPEIDKDNIFILGHSLGAMMIPRIAEDTQNVKGYIMMAAAVTPLHDLMIEQYEYIFNLDGKLSINERISLIQSKIMRKNVESLKDGKTKKAKDLFGINAPYWIYLHNYDLIGKAKNIQKPLLIIQGESDYQVPMRDFNILKDNLESKDNVYMISYEGLGHLMTTAGSPPAPDDYNNELHVDSKVINDIAEFIKNH